MSGVDAIAARMRWLLGYMGEGREVEYTAHGGSTVSLLAYVTGLSAEELVGEAAQLDVKAVIDAAAFATAFPARPKPQRFDRLATMSSIYTVEEINGRPNMDAPVFFFLRLRGGSQ